MRRPVPWFRLAFQRRLVAASAATATTAPRSPPRGRSSRSLAGRSVLRPLDQLLGLDERAVLVLGHELEADPAALLVDLLHDHVEHVAAVDHVLDVADAAGADVGDVQQAVRALLQLDEGAELRRLDDLAGVRVPDLRAPSSAPWIAAIAASAFVPSVA